MWEGIDDPMIWIIVAAFTMPLLLIALLIWFFLSYQKKKYEYEVEKKDALVREQALIIEQQNAIQMERNRIASEMHDELGSGLTSIKYLSDSVCARSKDETISADIKKIAGHSTLLVTNMSEIIWAMNSRFDNIEGLVGYIRRFAVEYLEDHHMDSQFFSDTSEDKIKISGEKRRNIYLVIKELLNNAVKYSHASKIIIEVQTEEAFSITIKEINALGYDPLVKMKEGNGLYNIQKRMKQIGGKITFIREGNDMVATVSLPYTDEMVRGSS